MEKFQRRAKEVVQTKKTFKCKICGETKQVRNLDEETAKHRCSFVDMVGEILLVKMPTDTQATTSMLQDAVAYEITVVKIQSIEEDFVLDENDVVKTVSTKWLVKIHFDSSDQKVWFGDRSFIVLAKLENERD